MKEVQALLEQVKADISDGKSEEEIFQSILPLIEKDPTTWSKVAEGIVTIPDQRIVKLLYRMFSATQEKKVRKIIKRSLYRLKSKGIALDEVPPDKEHSILRPFQAEPREGFASAIDFLGQRLLWLIVPHRGRGLSVMRGIISDVQGLVDFSQDEMTRKGFRNFFEEAQEKNPFPMVDMEPPYVAFLITQAHQRCLEKNGISPPDYLQAKLEIESIRREYMKPLVYSYLQADEIIGDDWILKKGGDLLKTDFFNSWRVEEDLIRPFADDVQEAEESKIILNPTQKEVRLQGIYQKALTDLFSEERRFLYQRRLEEMAYVLFKLGKEEESKICLAVAIDLEKPLNPLQPNPFLFQLVIKSIFSLLTKADEKKSKEVSLIVKP
jgi:hypothetical protein